MNALSKRVAAAGVALTTMTAPALADITLYGVKGGECFKTTYHARTGMHDKIQIGNKAPVVISVPESLRGNSKGAEIVFKGMSQVTANLVTSGAASGAALYMKCDGADAGAWSGFCGKGKVSKHGTNLGNIFERQCKSVSPGWGNNGPEKLYETLFGAKSSSAITTDGSTKRAKAAFDGEATVATRRKERTVVSEGEVSTSGGTAKIRACRDAKGCLSFELKVN